MKLSLSLSIMLGLATLFQGCSDGEKSPTAGKTSNKEVTISGKATLASVFNNKATVCLDTNNNKTCDKSEPTTTTDSEGAYSFTTKSTVKDGMLLIVSHGYTIIPLKDANDTVAQNIQFYKSYQSDDGDQNINIVSTLIADQLEVNDDNDYTLAIDDFANQYPKYIQESSSFFGTDNYVLKEDLTLDPIDEAAGWFFGWFGSDKNLLKLNGALQSIKQDSIVIKSKAPSRSASNSTLPDESTLDEFYNSSSEYFDELLSFIEDFINWVSSAGDSEPEEEDEDKGQPEIVDPIVKQEAITRNKINGVWYIIDKSGDKTCAVISSNNKISVTDTANKTTDLKLTYKQINNNQASILLKLGFFTADTIIFDKYMDDRTFDGHYASDGETLKGSPIDTLANCKATKLN